MGAAQKGQNPIMEEEEGKVTPSPNAGRIVASEERIEYRDENGNLLDEEQVKELEGKVSFKTRYETRTRIVDADGNEVADGIIDGKYPDGRIVEGLAPPHPDVEGRNPETGGEPQEAASDAPATVAVGDDLEKERMAEENQGSPRPASEGNEATN